MLSFQVPGNKIATVVLGGIGPQNSQASIRSKKQVTLKTGGNPALYADEYNEAFQWYPYLFLNRSKPETHLSALSRLRDQDIVMSTPGELISLITDLPNFY